MNILLLGSGGREHAISFKISQSKECTKLFIAPGNGGTEDVGENIELKLNDFKSIKDFSLSNNIQLIIVGPEEPLVNGIVDYFKSEKDCIAISILGPDAEGAKLEGSKSWAKCFMQEFGIPTANYKEFDLNSRNEGVEYLKNCTIPIVLKADGLAAGKGVVITYDRLEAIEVFNQMLDGLFGVAGSKIVIEQFLDGIEFSVFALTDGKTYKLLPEAKDYKRIGEGDTGPNTGGMGAVSPVPFANENIMQKVIDQIIEPTMKGLNARNIDYRGFIFFGLILVNGEPFVIEYNCRMGDPETEVVFPRIKNDVLPFLFEAANGKFLSENIAFVDKFATTIMLVSEGYPGNYSKGIEINGLEHIKESTVFHAGTEKSEGKLKTNGGRVMAITSFGETIEEARQKSLDTASLIQYSGKNYRHDIGMDLIKLDF